MLSINNPQDLDDFMIPLLHCNITVFLTKLFYLTKKFS